MCVTWKVQKVGTLMVLYNYNSWTQIVQLPVFKEFWEAKPKLPPKQL